MRSLTRFVEIVLCGLLLAALTPARWVRFAVPYTQIWWSQSYPFMIVTSGTPAGQPPLQTTVAFT